MRKVLHKNKERIKEIALFMAILVAVLLLQSCTPTNISVENEFPFTLRVLPYYKEMQINETLELRFQIKESGENKKYQIRYFPTDGRRGDLMNEESVIFTPNDSYPVNNKEFRLYYQAKQEGSCVLNIVVYSGSIEEEMNVEFTIEQSLNQKKNQ